MKEGVADDPFANAAPEPDESNEDINDHDEDQEDGVGDLASVDIHHLLSSRRIGSILST